MFKPIPNFEDYSINKKGIVRNCRGKLISHQTSKGCSTHFVSLYDKNGRGTKRRISWLVAEVFIPNPNNYKYVWHLDGNQKNHDVKNLKWSKYPQEEWPLGFHEFILDHYKGLGNQALTDLINNHFNTQIPMRRIRAYKHNHHLDSGLTGRFEKGNIPPNKGKKGYCHPGCVATQFKKGSKPPNTHPIGTEILREDGYIWIKVNDNPGPHNIAKRWMPRARYVWEQAHGPIGDDVSILHLDGDSLNDDLSNLQIVTNKECLVMNKNNLIYKDPELTKEGYLIAQTLIKIQERTKKNGS